MSTRSRRSQSCFFPFVRISHSMFYRSTVLNISKFISEVVCVVTEDAKGGACCFVDMNEYELVATCWFSTIPQGANALLHVDRLKER